MVKITIPVRRLIGAGSLALALAAAPAAAVLAAPSAVAAPACPAGEVSDLFVGTCVPELAPNVPAEPGGGVSPRADFDNVPCDGSNTAQCVPSVGTQEFDTPNVDPYTPGWVYSNGVPCDGSNTAECIPTEGMGDAPIVDPYTPGQLPSSPGL